MKYLLTIVVLSLVLTACSQNKVWDTARPIGSNDVGGSQALGPLTLGVGDEVTVSVWRNAELQREVKIDLSGSIYLPLIGEIKAAGMTIPELRKMITVKLDKYLVDPQVDVIANNITSKKYYILGEVNKSGSFLLDHQIGLLDAIASAGGVTNDANDKALLIRRENSDVKVMVGNINFAQLNESNLQGINATIQDKDIIFVPKSTIANIEDFMQRINTIINTFLGIQRGVILWPNFEETLLGNGAHESGSGVIMAP